MAFGEHAGRHAAIGLLGFVVFIGMIIFASPDTPVSSFTLWIGAVLSILWFVGPGHGIQLTVLLAIQVFKSEHDK